MATINYDDKSALYENSSIPEVNKVTDNDLNLIKQVGNQVINSMGLYTNNWSSTSTYSNGSIVISDNRLFKNITGTNTTTAPENDTTNWTEINIINGVVDSGSNTNGTYVKFINGTMICYKTILGTIDVTTSTLGGTFFYGLVNLGSPAANFTARPTINVTLQSQAGTFGFLSTQAGNGYGSATNLGDISIMRPTSRTGYAYVLDVIAIGRWY